MTGINWCIKKHEGVNHYYDKYLPYEFHLRMVDKVYKDFKHLINKDLYHLNDMNVKVFMENKDDATYTIIRYACWGHDLIEDTRVNYNEINKAFGKAIADIIYAVTNEKGRTREERANDKYYEGIRNTPGAVFVKLCDRIANVQYSKMTGSDMFQKYRLENNNFINKMGYSEDHPYKPMFDYLLNLFED